MTVLEPDARNSALRGWDLDFDAAWPSARAKIAAVLGAKGVQRADVEDVSARVAAALVDVVLERARADPILAQALASIYGPEQAWLPRAVSCAPD